MSLYLAAQGCAAFFSYYEYILNDPIYFLNFDPVRVRSYPERLPNITRRKTPKKKEAGNKEKEITTQ
ncbi:MAG: hypothetical protein G8345_03425 [Magnetococcales bacterium]|nr:hypothetical protein [Magnetococcales bacterium]NGZ25925.1 hypothetical protein [Magnetococcales bacterium]